MARPVDYRKGRGSKGVHTEDETVPLGKKDQGRPATSRLPIPLCRGRRIGLHRPTGRGPRADGGAFLPLQRAS
jgi:hypothetical protein